MIFTGRYEALSTPFLKEKEHRKCQNKQKEISRGTVMAILQKIP